MAMTQERKRDFTQHWSSIKPMILNVKPIFQWPFQEPIDWRYRFHIFLVYFSGLNFKIQDSQELSGANLESNHWIQDSIFQIPRNSLEQILNPTPGFKIQDSQELFGANLESNPRIQDSRFPGTLWSKSWIQPQDSRFKIPRNSLEQILNPTPGFQDSRFPGTLWSKFWIQPQDSRFEIPRNSLEQILNPSWILDSRFPAKSPWESWILNPGFKICWKESPGILNLESREPQDSRFKIPRNSLEQILNPTPGFKIQDSQKLFGANLESILNPGFKISCKESLGILNLESWIQDLLERVPRNLESWIQGLDSRFGFKICSKESLGILNLESIQLAMALQRHCKLDRCQRSQGSKKVGLGGGTIFLCIYVNGGRDINGARQGKYMTIWYHMISFSACIQIPFPLTLRTSLLHLNSFWNEAE